MDPAEVALQETGTLEEVAADLGDALVFHEPVWIDGVAVAATVTPRDGAALARFLERLARAGLAVLPRGAGTRDALGNIPRRADCFLSTAVLRGVDAFEPAEGVCHAGAGTPLAELRAAVLPEGWELPLDDVGRGGTLGGALATAALTPRAQGFGRPRDVVLGMEVALADGTLTRCGGRVVKNVTGYDLTRVYTGSQGALGVITGAWLRLRPLPELTCSLETPALAPDEACRRGVAWARRDSVRSCALLEESGGLRGVIELAGAAAGVARDRDELRREEGAVPVGEDVQQEALRRSAAAPEPGGFRFSVSSLASALGGCVQALREAGASVLVLPGLGVVIARFAPAADDARRDAIFQAVARAARASDGRSLCECAPPEAKRGRDVFAAPESEVRLTRALKARFDPGSALSPGRFAGGL